VARTERKAPKTWSRLGDVKRRPSVYEVTAAQFVHHFRREPAPFEMGPEAPLNQWYLKYREGSVFNVEDWEGFRDPAKLTYSDYVTLQHDRETYLDGLIDHHEGTESVDGLDAAWVQTLTTAVVPLRFPLHILQMTSLYMAQMAPSAFIINAANFQAADEMRRIQRLAYLTKWLANSHGDEIASTDAARAAWEKGAEWQPMRKALEELLGVYDWGEAFIALDLVIKPAIDSLLGDSLAALAAENGDELLSLMLAEFHRDAQRSKDWTAALARYAIAGDPQMADTIRVWAAAWAPAADALVAGYAPLLTGADAATVAAAAARARADLLTAAGL
jgi:toluene monooxygenase system protein E